LELTFLAARETFELTFLEMLEVRFLVTFTVEFAETDMFLVTLVVEFLVKFFCEMATVEEFLETFIELFDDTFLLTLAVLL
jgi:hypothetical protein